MRRRGVRSSLCVFTSPAVYTLPAHSPSVTSDHRDSRDTVEGCGVMSFNSLPERQSSSKGLNHSKIVDLLSSSKAWN